MDHVSFVRGGQGGRHLHADLEHFVNV